MNQGPIFITGLTRSGKTLLSVMLASHPEIAISRLEPRMWDRFYGQFGNLAQRDNFERCLTAMLSNGSVQALIHHEPDYFRRKFWEGEPTYGRLFALFYKDYAEQLGKSRWGDHSQQTERYAEAIFANYPTARMIHMIRDPRDWYTFLTPRRGRDGFKKRAGQVGRDIARWLHSVSLAERNQAQYPNKYKIVRYEALVSQPEKTLLEICIFLGEASTPTSLMLEGLRGFREKDNCPKYGSVSTTHIGRFREAMSEREIAFVQGLARKVMTVYHYDLEPIQLSLRDAMLLYCVDWPVNLARQSISRARSDKFQSPSDSLPEVE